MPGESSSSGSKSLYEEDDDWDRALPDYLFVSMRLAISNCYSQWNYRRSVQGFRRYLVQSPGQLLVLYW